MCESFSLMFFKIRQLKICKKKDSSSKYRVCFDFRPVGLRCKFLPSELLHKLLDREASSVPEQILLGKITKLITCDIYETHSYYIEEGGHTWKLV